MADKRETQEIFRSNPDLLQQFREYFAPKPEIVTSLPNPRGIENFKEVFIKQSDGTYNLYKMINGRWEEVDNHTSGYKASDGSAGITQTVAILDGDTVTTHTLTFKDGLLTAYSTS